MSKFICFFAILISAQFAFSQDCNAFFSFEKGMVIELTTYDKKDKPVNFSKTEVISSEPTDIGGVKAEFQTELSDKKGKILSTGVYAVTCENGVYHIDISSMLNQDVLKNYRGMDLEVEGNAVDIPNSVVEGQQLEDVTAKIHIKSNGTKIITLTVDFVDRVVKGFETVTTDAGEFECVVVSFTSKTKMGFIKSQMRQTDYYAKNLGIIQSIVRNKKDKLINTTRMTNLIRP